MRHFILFLSLMSCSFIVFGQAANIKVHGTVIAAPCELEKSNYLIDLKKINIWNIKDTQKSSWVDFSVKLKNCPVGTSQAVMAISGTPDPTTPEYFINNGTAKNVALNLARTANKATIKNGNTITTNVNTQTRSVEIPLSARVSGYGNGMIAGSFKSHLEFTFTYQ
ncbi:MAG: fimbrial protein [Providencia rettgeri]|nr:fimbrial protein [Providencia rettgeri]